MTSSAVLHWRWQAGALGGVGCLLLAMGLYLNGFTSGYWLPVGAIGGVSVGTALVFKYAAQTGRGHTEAVTAAVIVIAGHLLLFVGAAFYILYNYLPVLVVGMGLLGLSALILGHSWTLHQPGVTRAKLLLTLVHASALAIVTAILLDVSFVYRTALVGINSILVLAFSASTSHSDTQVDRDPELR